MNDGFEEKREDTTSCVTDTHAEKVNWAENLQNYNWSVTNEAITTLDILARHVHWYLT